MQLTLTLNASRRILDLTHYPTLNQSDDEQTLDTVQTALEIGLKTLSQASGTIDAQALQTYVRQLAHESNMAFRNEATAILSRLAEDGVQLGHQQDAFTHDVTIQLTQLLNTHKTEILSQLSLGMPNSSISQVSELLSRQIAQIREAVIVDAERQKVQVRTPLGGMSYEKQVGEFLDSLVKFSGDTCQPVGELVGMLPNSKVGDFVLTLGSTRHVPNARIVVEAKHADNYTRKNAIDECQTARDNREARVAIFVWHTPYGEAKNQPPIEVIDRHTIIVLWDADDTYTDVCLHAAYWMACFLIAPDVQSNSLTAIPREKIEKLFKEIENMAKSAQSISSSVGAIQKQAQSIQTEADKIRDTMSKTVSILKQQVFILLDALPDRSV